jgi:hypothetical protein
MNRLFGAVLIGTITFTGVLAHDLFLKPSSFFVELNKKASITILNGTFQKSEGVLAYERITDVSVVNPSGKRVNPTAEDFTKTESAALLGFTPKHAGNYVVGLSIAWRENSIKAKEFNEYLVAEGIPQVLEERKRDGELNIDGRYRYSKYVKTILQADRIQSDNYETVLGYPVELIPQQNPYSLQSGDTLEVLCLKDGKPLANQLVMTGRENKGKLKIGTQLRSGLDGVIRLRLDGPGKWYIKFINMVKIDDPKLNYESKWANLTFEIR